MLTSSLSPEEHGRGVDVTRSFLKIVKASDGGLRNESSRGRQNGNHSGIRYIGTRVFGTRV
jgi:hypothetical protein